MKKLAALFGVISFFVAALAFANATATSVTGTVQAQAGSAPARTIRQGDIVRQGDTISTGASSSAVLRFEDGQIVALTANSRMTISNYSYNSQSGSGNVLLSLIGGGMRAISGLIGRNSPQNVTYKAASATIGIRGTDADIVIGPAGVVATVNDKSITFALPGQAPVVISTGEAIFARPDGTFSRGSIQQIANQLAQTPGGPEILNAINGLQGLSAMLGAAPPGTGTSLTVTPGPPPSSSSSAGGGGASTR
jgi:hypothetical protein